MKPFEKRGVKSDGSPPCNSSWSAAMLDEKGF
jgi:hypothetical protein